MSQPTNTQDLLAGIIRDLPYLQLLTHTRRPGTTTTGPRPTPDTQAPINVGPIALEQELHRDLAEWIPYAHDTGIAHPTDTPIAPTCHWTCTWLHRHAPDLDHSPAGPDWQREVHRAHHRLQQALGETTRRPRCECGTPLTGQGPNGPEPDPARWTHATCPACGHQATYAAAISRMQQETLALADLHPLAHWATLLGLKPNTLRMQLERAHITADARDPHGRKLYRETTINARNTRTTRAA